MSEYTAEDFAKARFAKSGRFSAHRHNGLWYAGTSGNFYDHEMAADAWTPVPESPELTIDTLRKEWESAEPITDNNPPRVGDTIIRQWNDEYTVYVSERDWGGTGYSSYRILRRKARPRGAGRLEHLLRTANTGGITDPVELADWLLDGRGVEVKAVIEDERDHPF